MPSYRQPDPVTSVRLTGGPCESLPKRHRIRCVFIIPPLVVGQKTMTAAAQDQHTCPEKDSRKLYRPRRFRSTHSFVCDNQRFCLCFHLRFSLSVGMYSRPGLLLFAQRAINANTNGPRDTLEQDGLRCRVFQVPIVGQDDDCKENTMF